MMPLVMPLTGCAIVSLYLYLNYFREQRAQNNLRSSYTILVLWFLGFLFLLWQSYMQYFQMVGSPPEYFYLSPSPSDIFYNFLSGLVLAMIMLVVHVGVTIQELVKGFSQKYQKVADPTF